MRFHPLSSILVGFLLSSGLLLGAGTTWEAIVGRWNNSVVPIPIPSDIPESPVSTGSVPALVAIIPDGSKALVPDIHQSSVIVLDLTQTPIVESYTVSIGSGPSLYDSNADRLGVYGVGWQRTHEYCRHTRWKEGLGCKQL